METKLIKLTKNQKKHMKSFNQKCKTANEGFTLACEHARTTKEILWTELGKMYPEAIDKGASFNSITSELTYTEETK